MQKKPWKTNWPWFAEMMEKWIDTNKQIQLQPSVELKSFKYGMMQKKTEKLICWKDGQTLKSPLMEIFSAIKQIQLQSFNTRVLFIILLINTFQSCKKNTSIRFKMTSKTEREVDGIALSWWNCFKHCFENDFHFLWSIV